MFVLLNVQNEPATRYCRLQRPSSSRYKVATSSSILHIPMMILPNLAVSHIEANLSSCPRLLLEISIVVQCCVIDLMLKSLSNIIILACILVYFNRVVSCCINVTLNNFFGKTLIYYHAYEQLTIAITIIISSSSFPASIVYFDAKINLTNSLAYSRN